MAIIVIKPGADREEFIRKCQQRGIAIRSPGALERHFIVDGVKANQIPMKNDPDIEIIEDGDVEHRPALIEQAIVMDQALLTGSWALARTIRRSTPWNRDRLQAPIETFYRSERDGTGTDIYIVDSGIDLDHPEFGGRAANIYEYASSGGAGDDFGHGTLCASAAAGSTCGFAKGALLFSFKSSTSSAGGSTDLSIVSAIGQVLSHYRSREPLNRPAVCSLSINPVHGATVVSAIGDLINAGITCCVAAGNDMLGLTIGAHPAPFTTDAICCGGTSPADLPYYAGSDATNWNVPPLAIMAPALAVRVASATARGLGVDYEVRRGTSISTPYTAGVVACMLQGHDRPSSRADVQAIKAALLANATTGKLRGYVASSGTPPLANLPDKILYLDPYMVAPEPITGL